MANNRVTLPVEYDGDKPGGGGRGRAKKPGGDDDDDDRVEIEVKFYVTCKVDMSRRLLAEVAKPDWQRDLYKLETSKAVAVHLAYNLLKERSLKTLDGFAHMDESDARLSKEEWDED